MIYLFGYTKTILFSKIENMPEMACQIFLNAKNALMDEMKSSIRKFLALTKMTRDEFADLCGVSKSQVDKWLSTVPIPRARQRLIIRKIWQAISGIFSILENNIVFVYPKR